MQLTGDYTFDADQQVVWALLMDPKVIADCIPGVKELIPLDGEVNAWRAEVKINIANISGVFAGIIRMSEIDAPTKYRLTVSGEGQQSIINGSALISLSPLPDSQQTRLTWDADANISGKLASIGQRLIHSTAKMMSGNFFSAVAKHLPAPVEALPSAPESVPAAESQPKPGAQNGIIAAILRFLRRLFGARQLKT